MIRYVVAASVAAVALLLAVTFARALPAAVERERVGRDNMLRGVCEQVLRPEMDVPALGGALPLKAPDFTLKDWSGKDISLSSLRGRVVLLNFWATWCSTCVVEMPSMERLKNMEAGRDFTLLAVSVDEGWDDIRRFFQKGTKMTVVHDPEKKTPRLYGTEKFPETYIIDKEGNVRFYVVSNRDWDSPGMKACMDALIDQ